MSNSNYLLHSLSRSNNPRKVITFLFTDTV